MSKVCRGVQRNSQLLPEEVTGGIKVCGRGTQNLPPHCLPGAGSEKIDWQQRGWRNTQLPRLSLSHLWETGKFPQSEALPLQLLQLTVYAHRVTEQLCWKAKCFKGIGWRKV